MQFRTQGNDGLDYAVILLLETEDGLRPVRVLTAPTVTTRCTDIRGAGARRRGVAFHGGALGEGMRVAIAEVERGYREMIEGWKRQ